MKIHTIVFHLVLAIVLAAPGATFGGIIHIDDLTIIDDAGNPSDGLGFLDLSVSNSLNLADALSNAQVTYADARLATPEEFDDLFSAAGIPYLGSLTASDGFAPGTTQNIAFSTSVTDLGSSLGFNVSGIFSRFWTDPDGDADSLTTFDEMQLDTFGFAGLLQSSITVPSGNVGWLIVSEQATVVPEPSSITLAIMGAAGFLAYGWRRKRGEF